MDQYAHLIAARLDGAVFSETPHEIASALDCGKVPILAPSRWLRAADPLPHAWDVTSDSIAAWVAGRVGASQLVLVKPSGVRPSGGELVDAYFARTLPAHVGSVIVAADQIQALQLALWTHHDNPASRLVTSPRLNEPNAE